MDLEDEADLRMSAYLDDLHEELVDDYGLHPRQARLWQRERLLCAIENLDAEIREFEPIH